MALRAALWLPNTAYFPEDDRLGLSALWYPGGSAVTPFSVRSGIVPRPTVNGAGPLQVIASTAMTVTLVPGQAVLQSKATSTAGTYIVTNDAAVTVTIAAANTNPRIDVVYLLVSDTSESDATNNTQVLVQQGTPAASNPATPSIPSNGFALANITVRANTTSILSTDINDVRRNTTTNGGILPVTSTTKPTGGLGGQAIWETDTKSLRMWDGATSTFVRAAPKGRVGGVRYNGGTGFIIAGNGIGPAEGLTGMQTPALTLEANRAFVIRVRVRFLLASATNVTLKVRETSLTGAVRATYDDTGLAAAFAYTKEFSGVYDTGSTDETHTYVVTGQQGTGLANYFAGDSTTAVFIDVTDVGPAGSLSVV